MLKKKKIMIVDGYNVLRNNAKYAEAVGQAPDFKDWTSEVWNAAREALLNDVCQLVDKNSRAIIVYDAARRVSDKKNVEVQTVDNVQTVFTLPGESADTRIQKLVYMYRQKGQEVEVITNDLAIQDATMNKGVVRSSAKAFDESVKDNKESTTKKREPGLGKIEDIVDKETYNKLRELRDSL